MQPPQLIHPVPLHRDIHLLDRGTLRAGGRIYSGVPMQWTPRGQTCREGGPCNLKLLLPVMAETLLLAIADDKFREPHTSSNVSLDALTALE